MRDLRFVGVDDDGTHLVLADEDGQQHRVEIDDALRGAVRAVRARSAASVADPNVRPKDVQGFLRAGMTIDEVAERTGWTVEKISLFEPPIRAERDHVATTAQKLPLRGRAGGREEVTTVGERVVDRLGHRGVISADITWDAFRGDRGWTIECRFAAGGRPRVATWRYDAPTQSLHPNDDEARWLSEDDQPTDNLPFGRPAAQAGVYDVIAEGGLDQSAPRSAAKRASTPKIPHAAVAEPQQDASESEAAERSGEGKDDSTQAGQPVDLVSVMRERSRNRRRASSTRRGASKHPSGSKLESPDDAPDASAESQEIQGPSVDELGHDPVTGTADLFGLKEVEPLRHELAETDEEWSPGHDESGRPAPDDEPDARDQHPDVESELEVEAEPAATADAESDAVPDRPSQARKGRPSVPSWDDIMFGKRGPKD